MVCEDTCIIIAGAVGGGVVLLVLVIIVCYCKCNKRRSKQNETVNEEDVIYNEITSEKSENNLKPQVSKTTEDNSMYESSYAITIAIEKSDKITLQQEEIRKEFAQLSIVQNNNAEDDFSIPEYAAIVQNNNAEDEFSIPEYAAPDKMIKYNSVTTTESEFFVNKNTEEKIEKHNFPYDVPGECLTKSSPPNGRNSVVDSTSSYKSEGRMKEFNKTLSNNSDILINKNSSDEDNSLYYVHGKPITESTAAAPVYSVVHKVLKTSTSNSTSENKAKEFNRTTSINSEFSAKENSIFDGNSLYDVPDRPITESEDTTPVYGVVDKAAKSSNSSTISEKKKSEFNRISSNNDEVVINENSKNENNSLYAVPDKPTTESKTSIPEYGVVNKKVKTSTASSIS